MRSVSCYIAECDLRMRSAALLAVCVLYSAGVAGCRTAAPRVSLPPAPLIEDVDIQALIDAAPDGSLVTIPRGWYVLPKGLVIRGRRALVIRGESSTGIAVADSDAHVLAIEDSQSIRIERVRMRHLSASEGSTCDGNLIDIRDAGNVALVGCELSGCAASGVVAERTQNLTIQRCHLHHLTHLALRMGECQTVNIVENVIEENASFARFDGVEALQMHGNVIHGNDDVAPAENR